MPCGFVNCKWPALPNPPVPVGRPEGAHVARWSQGTPGCGPRGQGRSSPLTASEGNLRPARSGNQPSAAAQAKLVRGFGGCCAPRHRRARYLCLREALRSPGGNLGWSERTWAPQPDSSESRVPGLRQRAARAAWGSAELIGTDPLERRGPPGASSPGSPGLRSGHPRAVPFPAPSTVDAPPA